MEIVKTAPRIQKQTAEYYKKYFDSLNGGLEYTLESWPMLFNLTMHGLKKKFQRGELMLLIDVMNGSMLTPRIAGQHLDINVSDGIALDRLDEKWEIDGANLNAKISALSYFEKSCLEIWIQGFWAQDDHGNIEEYVAEMTGDE